MGLRRRIVELMKAGDTAALRDLAVTDHRSLRPLVGRLWDPDPARRQMAAEALGEGCAAHPDHGREVLRGFVWALCDEAATNGRYVIPAFGAVGARAPQLAAPFVGPILAFAWDDGLRADLLEAVARIADVAPEIVRPHLNTIAHHGRWNNPREAQALARLLGGEESDN